jgi:hypothetical protein
MIRGYLNLQPNYPTLTDVIHDFAIVNDRYIVDPWIKLVVGRCEHAVHDLADYEQAAAAAKIYGDPSTWEPIGISFGEKWHMTCLPATFPRLSVPPPGYKASMRHKVSGTASPGV